MNSSNKKKRIAICVSGGSGMIYAYRLLKATSEMEDVETHLVITKNGKLVLKSETGMNVSELEKLADFVYDEHNFMSPLASGSFRLDGIVIVPCSMKTLSGVAHDYEENLVVRAAGVALKERWPLILMVRETPLSTIQLENMLSVSKAGGIIMPPLHPFYFHKKTLEELVDITVGKVLAILNIESNLNIEWGRDVSAEENTITLDK